MRKISQLLCLAAVLLTNSTLLNAQTNAPRKYFFQVEGGFFTGDAIGYVLGAGAGLRLGNHSLVLSYQKLLTEDNLTAGANNAKYDLFDASLYTLKAYTNMPNMTRNEFVMPIIGLGVGYSTTPHTHGPDKTGDKDRLHGYYESIFINPALGIDFALGNNKFFFTELNYQYHIWTKTHSFWTQFNGEPRKHAQVISLKVGVKI